MPLSGTAFSPAILDLDGQVKAADKDFNSQAIRVSRPSRPSRPPPPGIRRAPASKVKVFEPAKSLLSPTGVFDSRRSDDDLPTQDAKRSYGQRIDLEAAVDARAAAWSSFSTSVKNDISAALRLKFRDVALEARKKGNSKLQKRLEDFIESILDGFGNFLDTYGIADQNITSHRIQAVESYCKQLSAQVFRLTASHCDVEEKVTELEYEEQINELHRTVAKRTEEFHLVTQKHQKVNDELLEWTVMLEMDLDRSIQKLSEAREEGGISVQKFVAALKTEKPKALFDTGAESPSIAEKLQGSRNCEERAGSAALSHSRPPSRSDRPGEKFLHQQHRFIQKLSTVGDDLLKVVRKSQSARNKIVAGSCEPLDAMRRHDSFSGISVRLNAPVFSNEEMPGLVLERDAEAITGRGTVQKREAGNFNEMKKIKRQSDSTKRFQKASKSLILRERSARESAWKSRYESAKFDVARSQSRAFTSEEGTATALPENVTKIGERDDHKFPAAVKLLENALGELERIKAQLADSGITIEEEKVIIPARARGVLEIAEHIRKLLYAGKENFVELLTMCARNIDHALRVSETKRLRKTFRAINGILDALAKAVVRDCDAALLSPVVRTQMRQLKQHYEKLTSLKFLRAGFEVGDTLNLSNRDDVADDCVRIHFDNLAGGSSVRNFLHSFV